MAAQYSPPMALRVFHAPRKQKIAILSTPVKSIAINGLEWKYIYPFVYNRRVINTLQRGNQLCLRGSEAAAAPYQRHGMKNARGYGLVPRRDDEMIIREEHGVPLPQHVKSRLQIRHGVNIPVHDGKQVCQPDNGADAAGAAPFGSYRTSISHPRKNRLPKDELFPLSFSSGCGNIMF